MPWRKYPFGKQADPYCMDRFCCMEWWEIYCQVLIHTKHGYTQNTMEPNRYKSPKTMTLFGLLEKSFMRLNSSYFNGFSSMYVLRLLYLFFLVLIYVWNSHYQEKTLHKINQLQPIVNGLRVRYMELQSQYMSTIQQSEIAKRVSMMAIYESKVPPYIIKAKPE